MWGCMYIRILYVGMHLHKDSLCGGGHYIRILYVGMHLHTYVRIPYQNNKKNIEFIWGSHYIKIIYVGMYLHKVSWCGEGHYIRILYVEEAFTKKFISKAMRKYWLPMGGAIAHSFPMWGVHYIMILYVGEAIAYRFSMWGCIYIRILYVGEAFTWGFLTQTLGRILISYGGGHYIRILHLGCMYIGILYVGEAIT